MRIEDTIFYRLAEANPKLVAQILAQESEDEDIARINQLSPSLVSEVISKMDPHIACQVLTKLETNILEQVMDHLLVSEIIKIFYPMPEKNKKELLKRINKKRSSELIEILELPLDCAGTFMDRNPLVLNRKDTVLSAIKKIHLSKKKVLDLHLVGEEYRLVGKVPIENLIGEDDNKILELLMLPPGQTITIFEKIDDIKNIFEQTRATSIPVVGINQELLGVIRFGQIIRAFEKDAAQDIMAMTGVSREERALSPPILSVKNRLPWLFINLATAFIAAAIVGLFENTIAKVTALAVLMPVVAGQSGNTGAQAMAVAMRGLALKEIRTKNFLRVLLKEIQVGLFNGAAIAIFTAFGVLLWNPDKLLALLLGISMMLAMVLASITGALIPIILTALKKDPATASSIVLTTMTDVISFFSFLGLATIFIENLV